MFTFFWNYTQSNSGFELVSLGIGTPPVCGDLDMDGIIDATDLQRGREHLVGATLSGPFFPTR